MPRMEPIYYEWAKVAQSNGISVGLFNNRVTQKYWEYERAATQKKQVHRSYTKDAEYALYKGEELLSVGTMREIAAETGKTLNNVIGMRTPTYKKRRANSLKALLLVELSDDD